MKKFFSLLVLLLIGLMINMESFAINSSAFQYIERLNLKNVIFLDTEVSKVYINGEVINLPEVFQGAEIISKNGRVLVPVRFLSEKSGAQVQWDASRGLATIDLGDIRAEFYLYENNVSINKQLFSIDVGMQIYKDRIYIPARFFAEKILKKQAYYRRGLVAIGDDSEIAILQKNDYVFYKLISEVRSYSENPLFLIEENKRYGYIDATGKKVIETKFLDGENFSEGVACVADSKWKYSYINEKGEIVLSPECDYSSDFGQGIAVITKGKEDFLINIKGEKLKMQTFSCGNEGISFKMKSRESSYYDNIIKENGDVINYPDNLKLLTEISEGYISVYDSDGKHGFINTNGELVIECKYFRTNQFTNGLAAVQFTSDRNSWGIINNKDEVVIKPQYEWIYGFTEGLCSVKKDGKYGYIDSSGKFIIEPKFDWAGGFSDGRAYIRLKDKDNIERDYYIDKTGAIVIDMDITSAGNFQNGLAYVMSRGQGKTGYINKKGEWVWFKPFEEADLKLY